MSVESKELFLYACNKDSVHERTHRTCQMLAKHYKRGNYNKIQAVKAFTYVADFSAQCYTSEHSAASDTSYGIFSATDRRECADMLEREYREFVEELAGMPDQVRVVISNRGTDKNGNAIASHTVFEDGILSYKQKRRAQIGNSGDRSEWANNYIIKTYGEPMQMAAVRGNLPAGSKHFDNPNGTDTMELIYSPASIHSFCK